MSTAEIVPFPGYRKLKVYLAGPMRGIPKFNFPAFDFAAARLRALGFEVFSPADHDREVDPEIGNNPTGDETKIKSGLTIRDFLGADLAWITKNADIIALLPGWEKSAGANSEFATGIALGLSTLHLGREFVQ